jgi:hypothetical protein
MAAFLLPLALGGTAVGHSIIKKKKKQAGIPGGRSDGKGKDNEKFSLGEVPVWGWVLVAAGVGGVLIFLALEL